MQVKFGGLYIAQMRLDKPFRIILFTEIYEREIEHTRLNSLVIWNKTGLWKAKFKTQGTSIQVFQRNLNPIF